MSEGHDPTDHITEFTGRNRLRQHLLGGVSRAYAGFWHYTAIKGHRVFWWRQIGDPGYAEVHWPDRSPGWQEREIERKLATRARITSASR